MFFRIQTMQLLITLMSLGAKVNNKSAFRYYLWHTYISFMKIALLWLLLRYYTNAEHEAFVAFYFYFYNHPAVSGPLGKFCTAGSATARRCRK